VGADSSTVAVVTGSTKGIGRAIAAALVGQGAKVVVSSRTESLVRSTAEELTREGPGEAVGIACDVRDPASCEALVSHAVERFGRLDILVNNAGVGIFARVQDMKASDWETQIRTNLDAVFYCSRAAIPHLIASGRGWIVNIASLAGRSAHSGSVAYSATKWGLIGMSEVMMEDLRHDGVRVTCVLPGSVDTDFMGRAMRDASWKLAPEDVAEGVIDLLTFPPRALPSRLEIRPSRPPRG
jgi:NAD(P)-dependent dehydrogenase (short-subunit alcohol dehydrogenase family)